MQISTPGCIKLSAAALLWGWLSAPLHGLVLMLLTWAPGSVGAGAGLSDGTGPSFLKIYTLRRRFQRLDTLGNVWAPKALHWHLEVSGGSQKVESKTGDRVETLQTPGQAW